MRSPNTQSSQVQFQQNTAPYFVSHLDSMSSHKLTLHSHCYGPMQRLCHPAHFLISSLEPMQRLCHPVPYGPMQRLCHPAHLFLYFFINLLPEPMHVCVPAHVWTLQRLAIRSTALTSYNFLFRFVSEPMQRLCHPVPYGPMQRLCHPAHFSLSLFLLLYVKTTSIQVLSMARIVTLSMTPSTMLKSKTFKLKLQISSPRFPLLLFSLWATSQRKSYTTALLSSQDPLQSSNAANLIELHASFLVVQDVNQRGPRFTKEPSRVK